MDIQPNEIKKKEALKVRDATLDIQAILTVIGRRKYSFKSGIIFKETVTHNFMLKFSRANLQINVNTGRYLNIHMFHTK
jgi:hypothetical protein